MKCLNCGEPLEERIKLCKECLPIVEKRKLKANIKLNLKEAKYFEKYDYHQRIEMAEYNQYIERADKYTKALVESSGLHKDMV
ncbi:MAG: hypothetical protein PF488_00515 [Patescibacteria group bacterium]|jgi:hypothetical protein|nr:hypothetical protein [Patescibacteria group bacterium]